MIDPIEGDRGIDVTLLTRRRAALTAVDVRQPVQAGDRRAFGIGHSHIGVQRLRQRARHPVRVDGAQADAQAAAHGDRQLDRHRIQCLERPHRQFGFAIGIQAPGRYPPLADSRRPMLDRSGWHVLAGEPGPAQRHAAADGRRRRQRRRRHPQQIVFADRHERQHLRAEQTDRCARPRRIDGNHIPRTGGAHRAATVTAIASSPCRRSSISSSGDSSPTCSRTSGPPLHGRAVRRLVIFAGMIRLSKPPHE